MAEPFIGQVMLFAGTFAPQGWAFCDGSLLNISQNTALFSLLGTTYGGNGTQNFALPDLRGRVAVGMGTGPGLPPVTEGQTGGSNSVTLTASNLPAHTHPLNAVASGATTADPTGAALSEAMVSGRGGASVNAYAAGTPGIAMAANSVGPTGSSSAVSVLQPYLGMNYIIALQGIYPSRN